jgi:ribosomal protein L27
MYPVFFILIALCIIPSVSGSAQQTDSSNEFKNMCGKWFFDHYDLKNDVLVYEKKSANNTVRWGNYIILNENHELIVGKSAQCGNDQSIFSNYGIWNFEAQSNTLNTSIDILKNGKCFKIIQITPTTLRIKKE